MEDYLPDIKELSDHKITWDETHPQGSEQATIYTVTDEDYQFEHDGGFIGYILKWGTPTSYGRFDGPYSFGFDGWLFAHKIEETDLYGAGLTTELISIHKTRMRAIEMILATDQELGDIYNRKLLEKQAQIEIEEAENEARINIEEPLEEKARLETEDIYK